jgi:hypothetical protein
VKNIEDCRMENRERVGRRVVMNKGRDKIKERKRLMGEIGIKKGDEGEKE